MDVIHEELIAKVLCHVHGSNLSNICFEDYLSREPTSIVQEQCSLSHYFNNTTADDHSDDKPTNVSSWPSDELLLWLGGHRSSWRYALFQHPEFEQNCTLVENPIRKMLFAAKSHSVSMLSSLNGKDTIEIF